MVDSIGGSSKNNNDSLRISSNESLTKNVNDNATKAGNLNGLKVSSLNQSSTESPAAIARNANVNANAAVSENLPKTGNSFIDSVSKAAIQSQRATGVPASVTIAQALIESGSGKSGLTQKANNYFGIKGTGPAGSIKLPTREVINGRSVTVKADFRAYNNAAESFTDHGKFFQQNSRYSKALQHTDDAHRFAQEIQKAGYATDPNYAKTINSVIDKYNLTKFDQIARSNSPISSSNTPTNNSTATKDSTTRDSISRSTNNPSAKAGALDGISVKSATPPAEKPIAINRNILRQGATGTDVRHLQEALTKQGFNPGPKDGIFGPKTEAALRAFQNSKGIAVDGVFGPQSRAAFTNKANTSPGGAPRAGDDKPTSKPADKPSSNRGRAGSTDTTPANGNRTTNTGGDIGAKGKGSVSFNGKQVSDPALRNKLQQVADFFGRNVSLTSGDRDFVPKGGSKTSLHLEHRAADLHVEGLSDAQVFSQLKSSGILDKGFEVIRHGPSTITGGPHVHIGHYDNPNRASEFKVEGLTPGTKGVYRRV